jgi:hypothetical protein
MTSRSILLAAALALGACHAATTVPPAVPPPAPVQPARPPRLVVLLVIDQMRADYLEWYGGRFTGGLQRLMREGAWFTNAAYPYLNTVTCAGHSTIGTGTFPYQHGMVLNAWYDRATAASPTCTADPAATEVSYSGLTPGGGDSPARLLKPGIGEVLREGGRGRAVVLSLKPRSAIPLAGHAADAVAWFDDRAGWVTSSSYGSSPALADFITANPPSADAGRAWDRLLPAGAYQHDDDMEGERPSHAWTRTFPHALGSAGDQAFIGRWQRSPFSDAYLGRMAEAMIERLQLGNGRGTDFLGVSFSALDLVGHAFGPRSHEVQDVLFQVDATIGRLLAFLDERVGAGNYVVGLSADHGVAEVPEQITGGGRLLSPEVQAHLRKALAPLLGPGSHVASVTYTDIYLTPAAAGRIAGDGAMRSIVLDALDAIPGVTAAFYGADLADASARSSGDPLRRAAALSYFPGRSGDLIIVPRERWIMSTSATTHGTSHWYDSRVPVFLFGSGVEPGRYAGDATPADLAPSLAAVAGVPAPPTDGRILREALKPAVVK